MIMIIIICGFVAEWLRCKDSDKASNSDFDPRCETIDDLFCSISQGRKVGPLLIGFR